jgi:hypothetical protein
VAATERYDRIAWQNSDELAVLSMRAVIRDPQSAYNTIEEREQDAGGPAAAVMERLEAGLLVSAIG